jgi:hypothetical protein
MAAAPLPAAPGGLIPSKVVDFGMPDLASGKLNNSDTLAPSMWVMICARTVSLMSVEIFFDASINTSSKTIRN